jgi:hypothetical protein
LLLNVCSPTAAIAQGEADGFLAISGSVARDRMIFAYPLHLQIVDETDMDRYGIR